MINKGDASAIATGILVAGGFIAQYANAILALCAIITAISTVWYHRALINQKRRDRALEHKKFEAEQERLDETMDKTDPTE